MHKLMNVLAGGLLLILAAGCASKPLTPDDITDPVALDAKIDQAIAGAAEKNELTQWWDVFLPYISLTEFNEAGPGVWMVAIVDKSGEYVWHYVSEDEKFWVNPQLLAPRLRQEMKENLAALNAGERVWGKILTVKDGSNIALYYVQLPDESRLHREGAPQPQFLAVLVVDPPLEVY